METKAIVLSDKAILDVWDKNVQKRSRDGKMMLFEDYRLSLGGADAGWGTKVFYKSCVDLGILSKCENTKSHCPTDKVIEKYVDLFHYDKPTAQWGISSVELDQWNENILPHIVLHAKKVRLQFAEGKKIRAKARYFEKKNTTKELF